VYKINKKQKKKINYNIIKTQKKNYIFLKINQIELNLKKIIKIVYKFNNLYLNFLFLNFNKCFFNLLKKINQSYITNKFWTYGLFDNFKLSIDYVKKYNLSKFNLNTLNFSLLITNNNQTKLKNILNEIIRFQVPIIFFDNKLHLLNNNKINYKLYGNFSNQKLLYKIFNTILNRHNKKILYCKRNNKNEFN